jgi:hypothetical protein
VHLRDARRCHGGFRFDDALIEPVIDAYLSRVSPSRVGSVAVEDVEKALFTFQDEFVRECGIGATSDFVVRRVQAILAEFSRSSTDRPEQPEPDVLGSQPPAEPGKPENG